jgi:hypothetical protein
MSIIIEAIHGVREMNPLRERISETVELEPIRLFFGVLSGIAVGSLVWYLGLA